MSKKFCPLLLLKINFLYYFFTGCNINNGIHVNAISCKPRMHFNTSEQKNDLPLN